MHPTRPIELRKHTSTKNPCLRVMNFRNLELSATEATAERLASYMESLRIPTLFARSIIQIWTNIATEAAELRSLEGNDAQKQAQPGTKSRVASTAAFNPVSVIKCSTQSSSAGLELAANNPVPITCAVRDASAFSVPGGQPTCKAFAEARGTGTVS